MNVFPLIYSRILKDDYPNGFLVRPSDLDVSTASKYVIPAMENIMYVGGVRHAVFAVGDYLIYGGVSCVASSLVERIVKSQAIDFSYEEYMADKAGRPMIFFIGFAVRKYELVRNELPDINLYGTYKIYLSYLMKQWHNEKAITDTSEGVELKTRPYTMRSAPLSLLAGGKHILRNYCEDDFQEAIDYYFAGMAWGRGGDFSFLSNVLPDDAARSPFANISVYNCSPEECVRRMEARGTPASYVLPVRHNGTELRTNNILNKKIAGVPDGGSSVGTDSVNTGKKKTSLPRHSTNSVAAIIGVLAVAAIIALLLFLLLKPKKVNASQQSQVERASSLSALLEQSEEGSLETTVPQAKETPKVTRTMAGKENNPLGELPNRSLAGMAGGLSENTETQT